MPLVTKLLRLTLPPCIVFLCLFKLYAVNLNSFLGHVLNLIFVPGVDCILSVARRRAELR